MGHLIKFKGFFDTFSKRKKLNEYENKMFNLINELRKYIDIDSSSELTDGRDSWRVNIDDKEISYIIIDPKYYDGHILLRHPFKDIKIYTPKSNIKIDNDIDTIINEILKVKYSIESKIPFDEINDKQLENYIKSIKSINKFNI